MTGLNTVRRILVTCPRGAHDLLAAEINSLGLFVEPTPQPAPAAPSAGRAKPLAFRGRGGDPRRGRWDDRRPSRRPEPDARVPAANAPPPGVWTKGTLDDCMKLNLHLRTAHRVLMLMGEFRAADAAALYDAMVAMPWELWLHATGHLCVTSSVENETIRDTRFASLKAKDAIVDRMLAQCGSRPDAGPERDDMVVHLHWRGTQAGVYLDTSGEPLSKRGYRTIPMDAPMQETLAAVCVLASGWKGGTPFVNPMCGSGTLAIEAALVATNRAPGLTRRNFGFMHLKGYRECDWRTLRDAATAAIRAATAPILASDIRPAAVEAARKNAAAAGVEDLIQFAVCDYRESVLPPPPGVIMLNPEYGVRMGEESKLAPLYKEIGDYFKQKCAGYMGYIFTGNLILARAVGLHSKRRLIYFSGGLECRLLEFELYEGTRNP